MPLTREQPTVFIREVFTPQTQTGASSGMPPRDRPPAPFGNGQDGERNPFEGMGSCDFALFFSAITSHLVQHRRD